MKRLLAAIALLFLGAPAYGQQVNLYCPTGTTPPWAPCAAANPLQVSASFTPSGTQNVNLTQILGAAPSLTNPLWVFPATGATFPISGTISVSSITGTGSNATSGVATSSTNLGTVSYNYGFNGTTWDQLQVDANKNLKIGTVAWGGGTLGAMANYGTTPGAVLVPGVNAFITNVPSVTLPPSPLISSGSGVVIAPSAEAAAGATVVQTSALAANLTVKGSAGNLYSFNVSADSTLSAAAWWIMIYDATSAPVDGAVTPDKCYAMTSGTTSFSAAFPNPAAFSSGIVIGVSTNGCFTKAASTHAFISGDFK